MNKLTIVVAIALFAIMTSAACSDDSRDSGGTAAISMEDAPAELADAFCARFDRCLGALAILGYFGPDCAEEQEKAFEDSFFVQLQDALDRGTVEYHADKMGACLAALENAPCDELNDRGDEECEAALTGTIAEGDDCLIDAECAGAELFCDTNQACPGICATRLGAGETCDGDDDCISGLTCSDDTARCVTPAGLGESCDGGSAPSCEGELMCQGSDDDEGRPGTCATVDDVFALASGEVCSFDESLFCQIGQHCSVTGRTATGLETECMPTASATEPCYYAIPDMCPATHYCDLTVERIIAGEYEGACQPLPGVGDPCVQPVAKQGCPSGSVCLDAVCVAKQRLGGGCTADAGCYSGTCDSGGCTAPPECEE